MSLSKGNPNQKPNPQSSFIPLSFDVTSLIKYKLSDDLLARVAASGSLRSSSCRSAVWRLVLRCLPYETSDWETSLSRSRNNYRILKETHLIDPHDTKFSQDPQLNNPLVSVEQNPWNTFFEDKDLRDIIGKDVARTFPEIEFFQSAEIRQIMSDILLIYAKENPYINYRQGMHEILAPLIFVIYSDNEAFQHAKENDELKMLTVEEEDIINCLFCKDYLERDSYNLFCAVMLEVSRWYEDPTSVDAPKQLKEPYMRVQDSVPASRLMEDLVDVGNLLQEIDPTLAKHLSALDIPPQLYGIRWLRLLFGRELPLHDLLFLWDVLLIDRPIAPLAKCIFVSLLVQIRHLLLTSDYGGCLQYLMRYPPIADIDSFVKLARHYRNPKKNAKPVIKSNNFTHITVTGSSHPNSQHRPVIAKSGVKQKQKTNEDPPESPPTILALAPVLQKVKNSIRDRSNTVSVPSSPRKSSENPLTIPQKMENWTREVQMMEEQVSALQTRLNEQDVLCFQVSKALEIYAEDVRNAKSSEKCAAIAENLLELSRTLTSSKLTPSPKTIPQSSGKVQQKPSPPNAQQKIQKVNEMVDMTSTSSPLRRFRL
ncbi:unnamed protein product [Caenorhabditis sp. 36 PRJEB53466]|nr:unnamed protein product [Caenorhabditis sp. 36 PRJEB53466]